MTMFGPWHPDAAAINVKAVRTACNCTPAVHGFQPLKGLAPVSDALASSCTGAAVAYDDDGDVFSFAGDATKLHQLSATSTWDDVTRVSGGDYAVGSGERWNFASSGLLVIGVNIADEPQKFLLGTSTNFEALGGTPPKARYIAVVRDFIVLGGLFGTEHRVQWSGLANAEHWTAGSQSSDYQDFQHGGPVRGVVGGEVGYIFQANAVTRMIFVPGSAEIFQFDEIEGGHGLAAPHSLVKYGNTAYYMASDGFYRFSLTSGASEPLGVGKWAEWFNDDFKAGTENIVYGGVDPVTKLIMWAYSTKSNVTAVPDSVLLYNWALDEATIADVSIDAMAAWLSQGVTLDTMNSYGTMDTLPFSLDSPVWRGGASLLGVFSTDNKLSFFSGDNMAAEITTGDMQRDGRTFLNGTRPQIDTAEMQVALAAREAQGDSVTYDTAEQQEDTGICPAHISGNFIRAKITVDSAAVWTKLSGITPNIGNAGRR